MTQFIGRTYELESLKQLLNKKSASLVVVRGRRRIGKSRLIEQFSSEYKFIRFSAIPPSESISAQTERDIFLNQLHQQLKLDIPTGNWRTDSWADLFKLLADQIRTGRVIVLFDEISWMGAKDPTFLGQFKNIWDTAFSQNDELIIFLCGSVSTWIEENIIKNTAFFGRISKQITLTELSLPECNLFLETQGFKGTDHDKLKILSVTGGIPWYLEQVQPKLNADENIKALCFRKDGLLVKEFNMIFHDLFHKKGEIYKRIIQALSKNKMEFNELCEALSYEKGGTLSSYLEDLIQAGFIERDYTWLVNTGKESRLSHYRLSDNYLSFYLKCIEPNITKIKRDHFSQLNVSSLPSWNISLALQFENLVLNNRRIILSSLNVRTEDIAYDNPYFQRANTKRKGCQIDYMIQTRQKLIFACEIKFSRNEIRNNIVEEMKEKLERLKIPRGYACVPVLIHASTVSDSVIDSNYFFNIIDFASLLRAT